MWTGKVAAVDGTGIVVNRGSRDGVRAGDMVRLETSLEVADPDLERSGVSYSYLGTIRDSSVLYVQREYGLFCVLIWPGVHFPTVKVGDLVEKVNDA